MPISLIFWVVFILWIVFGVWSTWPDRTPLRSAFLILLAVLIFLLGWHSFGFIVQ